MTDCKFIALVKREVCKYYASYPEINQHISSGDVFIVWYCKTLQNWKALASTTQADGMYFELTLNGSQNELYLDAYMKIENRRIEL